MQAAGTSADAAEARKRTLLPWITNPQPNRVANGSPSTYLIDAERLIATRVTELAARAIRNRPAWTSVLGPESANAERRTEWRHHVAPPRSCAVQLCIDSARTAPSPAGDAGGPRAKCHSTSATGSVGPVANPHEWQVHGERLVDDTPHIRVSLADIELPNHVTFTQYVFR
jgi:hypothetical protein